MFGREVTVDGVKIWVACMPDTPLSEVLYQASCKQRLMENPFALLDKGANYVPNQPSS
jgi:hypothetical protein